MKSKLKQEHMRIMEECSETSSKREELQDTESREDDFSPDAEKMEVIRNKVFPEPTKLSLTIHN